MTMLSSPQKLVLIVDDTEDNRVVLDRALRTSGYTTIQAASGREALMRIAERQPDLVLLDWMMPGFTGLDTLRAIRELYSKTKLPVIMCTALGDEMSVVTAITEGANDYMLKPISLAILRARISGHLEQRAEVDAMAVEKAEAERKLGEQTRALFVAMGQRRAEDRSGPDAARQAP